MRLVISETPSGPWVQLERESPAEWEALETLAAARGRTSGPGLDAEG